MKKILQIASYDFKRIALNPITLIVMGIVMVALVILNFTYQIPSTPLYKAIVPGTSVEEIVDNFNSENSNIDTKQSLDQLILDAQDYIRIQSQTNCPEFDQLNDISEQFSSQYYEIIKVGTGATSVLENNLFPIENAVQRLSQFIIDYKNLKEFKSKLFFEKKDFKTLEEVSKFFNEVLGMPLSNREKIIKLYQNITYIDDLNSVVDNSITWIVDSETLKNLNADYIEKANNKLSSISQEMEILKTDTYLDRHSTQSLDLVISLATNYKLVCESVHYLVLSHLQLLLEQHPINNQPLFGHNPIQLDNLEQNYVRAKFYLEDENLYFTQYQEPLNFNITSYEKTAYDISYFLTSIVGFFTIIFGIFCAYKLFGRDRKNGKLDLILSQNVTFGQVFAGKFLCIAMCTSFVLFIYSFFTLLLGFISGAILPNSIMAVFNLSTAYTISPFMFLIIKIIGIELQVLFFAIMTIFLMNLSRKFDLLFAIALTVFAIATVGNIFLNSQIWWCLLPFIHADLTSYLGGATMNTGFLVTSIYSNGNFFISLTYYVVFVVLLYQFTKQMFKKN